MKTPLKPFQYENYHVGWGIYIYMYTKIEVVMPSNASKTKCNLFKLRRLHFCAFGAHVITTLNILWVESQNLLKTHLIFNRIVGAKRQGVFPSTNKFASELSSISHVEKGVLETFICDAK